ncbi:MAG: PucR family transcriptional regulator, partial [Nocardioidaceae bacterium]
ADLTEAARSVLDDAASHLGPPVVTTRREGEAVALVPAADTAFADRLRQALHRLGPGVGRSQLTVGISEPSPSAALSGAWEEARFAQRLAELRTGTVCVVTGEEVTSHVLLLATVPDEVRRTFASRVLGPVIAYDAKHDSGLQDTLAAFLDCSGSWSRTAQRLHLHVNTVRYRIARVEDLTGRNLSDLEDRVDVFLALRSL